VKLTFLGTRGEVEQTSKFHKNDSVVRLETHGKIILLDFGKSWQGKLKFINPDYIWISHCYDDQTEILTDEGWKLFRNLNQKEKVATLKNGELEFRKPSEYIEQNYFGRMYVLKTRYLDLKVSPNHNLYVKLKMKKSYSLEKAEKAKGIHKTFKKDAKWKGQEIEFFKIPEYHAKRKDFRSGKMTEYKFFPSFKVKMNDFLEFLGYFVSEGCANKRGGITITQKKSSPYFWDMFHSVEKIGFKPSILKHPGAENIRFQSIQLRDFLRNLGTHAYEKHIPAFFRTLSSNQIKIFLFAFGKGDGDFHAGNGNSIVFSTSSKKLADDLQELILRAGGAANIGKIKPGIFKDKNQDKIYKTREGYRLTWLKKYCEVRDRHRVLSKKKSSNSFHENYENYEGKIYSVNVPNHIIYVRRNGKPVWSGNSHPDHCLGLKMEKTKIPVFMSKETSDRLPEDKFPLQDRRVVKDNFKFDSINAQEIPVGHSTKAPMSGLIIETDEGKIGYFPDVLDIPNRKQVLRRLTIYIGDGSSLTRDIIRKIGGKHVGHVSIASQIAWCREAGE